MAFTDHFIQRPVLAIVVSSLLLLLGGTAISRVNIREFPEIERSVINVETFYRGASARTVQGFVTTPLQLSIAGARGIEYMSSSSNPGLSEIQVHVRLGENSSDVLSEVIAKVNEARGDLPREIEDPVVSTTSGGDAMMYLAFYSKQMTPYQITDYLGTQCSTGVGHFGRRRKSQYFWSFPGDAYLAGPGTHGRLRRNGDRYQRSH